MLADFHFLRPMWFFALIPFAYCLWYLRHQTHSAEQWKSLIAPHLLPHLLDAKPSPRHQRLGWVIAAAGLIAIIALAGPVWEKRPAPIEKNTSALVIALDLSPSMYSQDLKPSRLARARLKIIDALNTRTDGLTALIAYAGNAHVVSPLTEDTNNIKTLLPNLAPEIMPLSGSNTEDALTRAFALINDTGHSEGDVLLITDGIDDDAMDTLKALANASPNIRVNILAAGTESPTPIPSTRGGFVRDRSGEIVTTKIDAEQLSRIASLFNGRFHMFTDNNQDIETLVMQSHHLAAKDLTEEREFDQWHEYGNWLVLLLLPVILYGFRRGVLCLPIISAAILFNPQPSYAAPAHEQLLLNKNQRAVRELERGNYDNAKQLFSDNEWKAAAEYKSGNYEEAAKLYAQGNSATSLYNLGNSLAQLGKLQEALEAYEKALEKDPNLEDAQKNKKAIEDALEHQKNNEQQNQSGKDQNNSENQDQQNDQNSSQNSGENSGDSSGNQGGEQESQTGGSDNSDSNDAQNNSDQTSMQSESPSENQTDSQNQNNEMGSQSENNAHSSSSNELAQEESDSEETQSQTQGGKQDDSQTSGDESNSLIPIEESDGLTDEERAALEMRLRQVPDDPGLLLRNKFKYQHDLRRQQMFNGDWEAPENGAADRW